jgi:hypothetical protein
MKVSGMISTEGALDLERGAHCCCREDEEGAFSTQGKISPHTALRIALHHALNF